MSYEDASDKQRDRARMVAKGRATGSIARFDSTPEDWTNQGRALAENGGFSRKDVEGITTQCHPDVRKHILAAFDQHSKFAFRR